LYTVVEFLVNLACWKEKPFGKLIAENGPIAPASPRGFWPNRAQSLAGHKALRTQAGEHRLVFGEENRNLHRPHPFTHPSLTPSTPLLPASTLSAGECKVNRRMGMSCNPHAPRLKPKMASLYFWWPSRAARCVAMVEPPVSYSKFTVPTASPS
jgi:hypothetical protein